MEKVWKALDDCQRCMTALIEKAAEGKPLDPVEIAEFKGVAASARILVLERKAKRSKAR